MKKFVSGLAALALGASLALFSLPASAVDLAVQNNATVTAAIDLNFATIANSLGSSAGSGTIGAAASTDFTIDFLSLDVPVDLSPLAGVDVKQIGSIVRSTNTAAVGSIVSAHDLKITGGTYNAFNVTTIGATGSAGLAVRAYN